MHPREAGIELRSEELGSRGLRRRVFLQEMPHPVGDVALLGHLYRPTGAKESTMARQRREVFDHRVAFTATL